MNDNENPNTQPTQQQVIQQADPNVVADIVMGRLMQLSGGQQPSQQQRNLVNDTIASLKAGNFHEDFIEGIATAVTNVDAQIKTAVEQAVRQYGEKAKEERAVDLVHSVIAEFAEADELVDYGKEAIFANVVKKFQYSPQLAAERARFGQGYVDRAFWLKLAKSEVLEFYKKAGKEQPAKSGGPAMRPAAASSQVATPPVEVKPTELQGEARQRYESMYQLATRSGKTAEEAKEYAMRSAKRFMK